MSGYCGDYEGPSAWATARAMMTQQGTDEAMAETQRRIAYFRDASDKTDALTFWDGVERYIRERASVT